MSRIVEGAPHEPFLTGRRMGLLLFTLLLVNVFYQVDRILPFVLAESIKRDLGLSDTQLGLLTGAAFAVCNSLMSLPLAKMADRGSLRTLLPGCIVVWSGMTALAGMATNFLTLSVTRIGVALGEAGATPGGHALIARRIAPERRGMAIGVFSMGIPLGAMIGFAVGGRLADTLGWRSAFLIAGTVGLGLAVLVALVAGNVPATRQSGQEEEPFLKAGLRLATAPAFRWLILCSVAVGFASTPFYVFATPFLIRTHGFTTSEVGLAFGLLQGAMGIVGTLLAGRNFDRSTRLGGQNMLRQPAALILVAGVSMVMALMSPIGWLAIALFVPSMFAFAFAMPFAYGVAHRVAGAGKQALASSLLIIGSGLFGPTLGPLIVGLISDGASSQGDAEGLRWGLMVVPVFMAITGAALLKANRHLAVSEIPGGSGPVVKSVA